MLTKQFKCFADYNRWMNQKIYQACATLSDEQRKHNHGVFFKSLHGTLNHILLADKLWMGRFTQHAFSAQSLDQELHADFAALWQERKVLDDTICRWISEQNEKDIESVLHYSSLQNPEPKSCELWLAVTHFFNHQTHHRGQLTAMLNKLDVDLGPTDLIAMPDISN